MVATCSILSKPVRKVRRVRPAGCIAPPEPAPYPTHLEEDETSEASWMHENGMPFKATLSSVARAAHLHTPNSSNSPIVGARRTKQTPGNSSMMSYDASRWRLGIYMEVRYRVGSGFEDPF